MFGLTCYCIMRRMNSSDHRATIDRACRRIDAAETAPNLATLASEAGLSPGHFQRIFRAAVGLSPKSYALARRRERLDRALRAAPSVTDAIYDAGYETSSAAYRDSKALGMAPRRLRSGGSGETVRYVHANCSLGKVLVAATQRGICMVQFSDGVSDLSLLKTRFPRAQLEPADKELRDLVKVVVSLIDDSRQPVDLPLDIRGTAFQLRVWRALSKIPAGETLSYAQLARSIGAPTSVRAVARACASNQIAVLVPCHRVIATSGKLTGYRWGIERKRRLLGKEQAAAGD
jgi:AraC family transcriptional regulator, regulatory protein of adaptative response / methylated-DNA-[protein]-cysteine methyltransferase